MDSHDSVTNKVLILEKYRIALGLQDVADESPFALVSMKKAEDLHTDGLLESTYEHLLKSGLPEKTNMTIEDLLNLPAWKLKVLYRAHMKVKRSAGAVPTKEELTKLLSAK